MAYNEEKSLNFSLKSTKKHKEKHIRQRVELSKKKISLLLSFLKGSVTQGELPLQVLAFFKPLLNERRHIPEWFLFLYEKQRLNLNHLNIFELDPYLNQSDQLLLSSFIFVKVFVFEIFFKA